MAEAELHKPFVCFCLNNIYAEEDVVFIFASTFETIPSQPTLAMPPRLAMKRAIQSQRTCYSTTSIQYELLKILSVINPPAWPTVVYTREYWQWGLTWPDSALAYDQSEFKFSAIQLSLCAKVMVTVMFVRGLPCIDDRVKAWCWNHQSTRFVAFANALLNLFQHNTLACCLVESDFVLSTNWSAQTCVWKGHVVSQKLELLVDQTWMFTMCLLSLVIIYLWNIDNNTHIHTHEFFRTFVATQRHNQVSTILRLLFKEYTRRYDDLCGNWKESSRSVESQSSLFRQKALCEITSICCSYLQSVYM